MRYLTFGAEEQSSYRICILVNDIRKDEIIKAYIKPYGLDPEQIIVIDLHQAMGKKKTPVAEQKAYIQEILEPVLTDLSVELLIVGDGDYFKTLTKSAKVDVAIGYVLPTEFGPWNVAYVPAYKTLFYDPIKIGEKIAAGINAVKNWMAGIYLAPGVDIIKFAAYPETIDEIGSWLQKLLDMDCDLAIDIEAFSLKHYDAGIGTITFCWSTTEGIAFPIDILEDAEHSIACRSMLKSFFERFKRKAVYHQINYDVYVLIYQLFMDHILDNDGLLLGLAIMLRNWDDTKLISYLATNSCAGNELGLKIQAQEYAGNYAQEEIKDIRKIPKPQLLQYNLIDGLATHYVREKHWPTLVADQQLDIYERIFKPAIVDIIQMQLTGMPVDRKRVDEVEVILQADSDDAMARMLKLPAIQQFEYMRLEAYTNLKNSEWVKKRMTIQEMATAALTSEPIRKQVTFNPNSGPQLQQLLYDLMGLPVIARTDTKLPATDGDTLKSLRNHTKDADVISFLDALIDFSAVDKILTSFIPALKTAQLGNDGWYYLFGYFNLGGTVSGRLSSSNPNLQNLPANSKYAKLIKSCFKAPPGWFFCGIDFSSLEDRISALTTKDPAKLKVYTDGYDGHAMRAVAYWGDRMPDIDPNDVLSVNSIGDKNHANFKTYGHFRQDSKVPTFALTYGGTYIAIMAQTGMSQETAVRVETQYHVLYKVSDDWVAGKLHQACQVGYVTVAFGLRVRTPMLHQVILGTSKTPFQAEAEGRTAGNALGQSWCLLNSRAGSEFMGEVRSSDYKHDVKPCAQIHDAQYYLIRDNIDVVQWANERVVHACEWQDHPEIAHDEVKLGGEFGIFYPDWSKECVIPNGASAEVIYATFEKHVQKSAA